MLIGYLVFVDMILSESTPRTQGDIVQAKYSVCRYSRTDCIDDLRDQTFHIPGFEYRLRDDYRLSFLHGNRIVDLQNRRTVYIVKTCLDVTVHLTAGVIVIEKQKRRLITAG